MKLLVYLIAFLRTVFCVLLIIFGPLVFAVSIFDGFQENYLQWIARFVNVNLYLPIAMIVLSLVQEVLIYVLDQEIAATKASLIYQPSLYYVSNMVVPVCGIVGLMMVPKNCIVDCQRIGHWKRRGTDGENSSHDDDHQRGNEIIQPDFYYLK